MALVSEWSTKKANLIRKIRCNIRRYKAYRITPLLNYRKLNHKLLQTKNKLHTKITEFTPYQ